MAHAVRLDRRVFIDVKLVAVDGVTHRVEIMSFQGQAARGRIWSGRLGRFGWIADFDHGRVIDTPLADLPRETIRLRIK